MVLYSSPSENKFDKNSNRKFTPAVYTWLPAYVPWDLMAQFGCKQIHIYWS